MQIANPLGLDLIDDVTGYAPPHNITDSGKAETLAADMTAHGWNGAPIVVMSDYAQALTGTHRLAAAEQAGIPAPGVDLEDLLTACGTDLWERRYEDDLADLDQDVAILQIVNELDEDIRTAYGLDMH